MLNLRISMETDDRKDNKIIRINVLQVAMNLGTALGVYLIVFYLLLALAVKHAGLTLLALPMMLGIPVFAWYLIRRYRDSTNVPFFPFPVSWMLSILTFLFATALSCMAAYLYLRFLDHGELAQALMENLSVVMSAQDAAAQQLTDPAQIEQYKQSMDMINQSLTWFCQLPASGKTKYLIQSSLMWGNILSLIIAIITAKRIRLK